MTAGRCPTHSAICAYGSAISNRLPNSDTTSSSGQRDRHYPNRCSECSTGTRFRNPPCAAGRLLTRGKEILHSRLRISLRAGAMPGNSGLWVCYFESSIRACTLPGWSRKEEQPDRFWSVERRYEGNCRSCPDLPSWLVFSDHTMLLSHLKLIQPSMDINSHHQCPHCASGPYCYPGMNYSLCWMITCIGTFFSSSYMYIRA